MGAGDAWSFTGVWFVGWVGRLGDVGKNNYLHGIYNMKTECINNLIICLAMI